MKRKWTRGRLAVHMTAAEFNAMRGSYSGICVACGAVREGSTEPDAEQYPCGQCRENKVLGADNAVIMGYIIVDTTSEERVYE